MLWLPLMISAAVSIAALASLPTCAFGPVIGYSAPITTSSAARADPPPIASTNAAIASIRRCIGSPLGSPEPESAGSGLSSNQPRSAARKASRAQIRPSTVVAQIAMNRLRVDTPAHQHRSATIGTTSEPTLTGKPNSDQA